MTTGTLAFIIIGIILAQVVIVVLIGFYRRKRQYRELGPQVSPEESITKSGVTNASAIASNQVSTDPVWDGFREFIVQRRVMEDGNRSICSFYLLPVDGQPLPTFRPGQFLTFKLLIKDPANHQSKNVVRCYSLSDAPRPDYYRISIKRVPAPSDQTDAPPGLSSNFFHDHLQVGSKLLVKAPSGHFHLMEDESLPIVLIGGGIGITPMLSITNFILERGINRKVWLYYGVRNGDELIMKEHLQLLASEHHNFHLHICYSAPP
jgi:ferredoxin-NADP reductase